MIAQSSSTVSPFRRMRRTLPLLIDGDFGLVEGEAWWFDGSQVVVWCPQRLLDGAAHPMRVDLGAAGTHVDMRLVVVGLATQEGMLVAGGYLLKGNWAFVDEGDRARLADRVRVTEPALAESLLEGAPTAPAAPTAAPGTGRPSTAPVTGSVRDRVASARAAEIHDRTAARAAEIRKSALAPASGIREGAPRGVLLWAPREEARPEAEPARIAPRQARDGVSVAAVVAPGDPPLVLVRFRDGGEVARCTRLHMERLHILVAPSCSLTSVTRVLVVIQLPDQVHLQVAGVLGFHLKRGAQVITDRLDPCDLALVERARVVLTG